MNPDIARLIDYLEWQPQGGQLTVGYAPERRRFDELQGYLTAVRRGRAEAATTGC